jgi:hypothetical protein
MSCMWDANCNSPRGDLLGFGARLAGPPASVANCPMPPPLLNL